MTTTKLIMEIPEGSIPIDEAINRIQMDDYDDNSIYFIEINEAGGNHLRVQIPFDGKTMKEICDVLWGQCLNFELTNYHITSIARLIWYLDTPDKRFLVSYHMTLSSNEVVKGE